MGWGREMAKSDGVGGRWVTGMGREESDGWRGWGGRRVTSNVDGNGRGRWVMGMGRTEGDRDGRGRRVTGMGEDGG